MYTILVTENNELVTTVKERIMQRSKLVDNLHFLVDPVYKEHDMTAFTVMMEYVLPVSREYKSEILTRSAELYKDKIEFCVPFDTCLTKEPGKIEIKLTFVKVEMDVDGNTVQRVRKTSAANITIVPLEAWSSIIPDDALSAIDQRLVMAEAMIGAANDMSQYLYETKADNITVNKDTNTIQLTANGTPIGDAVEYASCGIKSFDVDEDDNITITLLDGRVIDLGNIVGASGAVFVPHVDKNKILTWTNDSGLENPAPVDLNPFDEWKELGDGGETSSQYTWEFI